MTAHKTFAFSRLYILLLLLLLLPFAYAAFFTFPGGDDYARALLAGHLFDLYGGIKEMLRAWMKWSGRYTHHFLVVFLGDAATSRAGYAIACLGNMALHYVALTGICREIAAPAPRRTAATLALFLLFSLAATHGSLRSSWYLLTDILCLGAGVGFTLMYIWSLCIIWNAPLLTRKKKVFSIAMCIIMAGCYEYTTLMAVMISVTAWLLARFHEHRHRGFFQKLCVISCVCLALSFFCRGNFRRRTKRDVDNAVMMGQLAAAWGDWCRYVAPRLLTPLYASLIVWAAWMTPRSANDATRKIPARWIVLYCLILAAGFMFATAIIHAASDVTLGGAEKIPAHMSIFCAMIFGFCLMACRNAFRLPLLRKAPACLLFAACLVPLAGSYNYRAIVLNAGTGALNQYAGARETRKAVMLAGKDRNMVVAPLDIMPFPVGYEPVEPDPKTWPTKYVSLLAGLDSVRAEPRDAATAWNALVSRSGEPGWTALALPDILEGVFAPALPGGPNATFVSDWLFLRLSREALVRNPELRVVVVTQGSPAAAFRSAGNSLMAAWPDLLLSAGTARTFRLSDPSLFVREDGDIMVVGLPVNASGLAAAAVHASSDGVRYTEIFNTQ